MDNNVQNNSANRNVNPTPGTPAYYANSNAANPNMLNANLVNPNTVNPTTVNPSAANNAIVTPTAYNTASPTVNPAVNTTAYGTATSNPNTSATVTNQGTTSAMTNVAPTTASIAYPNSTVNADAMPQNKSNAYAASNTANSIVTPTATANQNTATAAPQFTNTTTNMAAVTAQQPTNTATKSMSGMTAQTNTIMTKTIESKPVAGSGVVDSRTFTRLTDDWKYESDSTGSNTAAKRPSPAAAAPPVYDDTPRGPFRVFLRMLAGIIAFIVAAIPVCIYFKMEYISTLQMAAAIIPSALMVFIFLKLNKQITRSECTWLIIINFVLSLLLFWCCMACSLQKLYPILSFSEAWTFVGALPQTSEGMRIFLLQFLLTAVWSIVIGSGSAICYHKGYK